MNRLDCRLMSERLVELVAELAAVAADLEPLIRRVEREVPPLAAFDSVPPTATEQPSADMQVVADTIAGCAAEIQVGLRRLWKMQQRVRDFEGRLRGEEEGIIRRREDPAEAPQPRQEGRQEAVRRRVVPEEGTRHYPACGEDHCVTGCPWWRTAGCRGCHQGPGSILTTGHDVSCPAYVG